MLSMAAMGMAVQGYCYRNFDPIIRLDGWPVGRACRPPYRQSLLTIGRSFSHLESIVAQTNR